MAQIETHRVAVIGAGPIGIELAVALKQAGIDYVHIDGGPVGTTMTWYPLQMQFHSNAERLAISGVPIQTADQQKVTREEFLAYLRAVVLQFGLEIRTYERVESVARVDGVFELRTNRATLRAENVVLAIGAMHRPRLLGIPGENLPHVDHYFHEPHMYFGQRMVIIGGKNSAIEAAIRCQRAGAHVTLCYRGDDFDPSRVKFWLLPEIRSMLRDNRVHAILSATPLEIREKSIVLQTPTGIREEPCDFVLSLTGYEQDTTLFEQAGIGTFGEERKPGYNEATMETNVPGIFLAGTAIAGSPVGHVRIIVEDCHVHVPRIVTAISARTTRRSSAV
ncbi:MAG TPA: NAD(P)-binding domain-containing protein [Thermoanaerobaculia bacterium]|nr:NAD(P)-binding domain-containing protein [Thermoanaerobaculia bacterium]